MDWFAEQLLRWHDAHGRKDLPWQQDINPYRVWVSEIMLQQTQVTTVIDYFNRFMQRFPTVQDLAAAPLDEVLHHWTGLGYYARARNLHKAANAVVRDFDGRFPSEADALESLPGIGRSTAGAIRSIAMDQHAAILDGNVKRVLTRFHAIDGYPGQSAITNKLWELAEQHTPASRTGTYTQAIMDLGATLCTRRSPDCAHCPVARQCRAFAASDVERYPTPKPKKEKPARSARFFVTCLPDGAVLLQQRPLDGLWGGLWTPPERSPELAPEQFLLELGLTREHVARQHVAPVFRHTFTHYHLDIEPVYLHLNRVPNLLLDDDSYRWVQPAQLSADNQKIGLSAPAVRLLASLQEIFPD